MALQREHPHRRAAARAGDAFHDQRPFAVFVHCHVDVNRLHAAQSVLQFRAVKDQRGMSRDRNPHVRRFGLQSTTQRPGEIVFKIGNHHAT